MRIIIIDKFLLITEVLTDELNSKGHETLVFHDTESALIYLKHDVPDIIICSVRVGPHDGMHFLKIVKKEYKLDVPIFITSCFSPYTREEFILAGAIEFYEKPINLDLVFKDFQNFIKKRP